jgi:hypothetical protein
MRGGPLRLQRTALLIEHQRAGLRCQGHREYAPIIGVPTSRLPVHIGPSPNSLVNLSHVGSASGWHEARRGRGGADTVVYHDRPAGESGAYFVMPLNPQFHRHGLWWVCAIQSAREPIVTDSIASERDTNV